MKKSLLLWTLALFTGVTAQAGIILSETFTYPDGDISTAPGSPWVVHSGTTAATISNNMLRLTGGNSADVNALLSGGPYLSNSVAVLYSSFKLRLTSQPGLAGTYLAHFKDTNTAALSGFGARVWVSTSNTVTGIALSSTQFRVGIGNGSQADARSAQIVNELRADPASLAEGVGHHVNGVGAGHAGVGGGDVRIGFVTRFVPNTGVATIWLNPALETDPNVTATDIGVTRSNAIDVVSYAFRQAPGIGAEFIDDLRVGTAFTDVAGANNPPSITGIAKQNVAVNASTPALAFTVGDAETAAGSLVVSGSSSNPGLVPNANIVFAGSDSNRTVTVTPASNQSGTASITVTVTDADGGSASTTFMVSVGVPTISNIPNQNTPVNTSLGPIGFTVGDTETPAGSLTVTATSANQTLVTDGAITLGGSGANRTITISPESGQQGVVTITVTVSDGANSASDTFVLTVNPLLGVLRMDDFNRPAGPLVQNDGLWLSNGGTGGTNGQQMQIVGNKAQVTEDQSEDVSTELPLAGA